MSSIEPNKKKFRALLNSLRETCVYRETVTLRHDHETTLVEANELIEVGFRDLSETKSLKINSSKALPKALKLLLSDGTTVYIVQATSESTSPHSYLVHFKITDAKSENRREKKRKKIELSYFTPAILQIKNSNLLPITGFAKVVDSDETALAFEIRLPVKVSLDEISNSVLEGQSQLFLSRCTSAEVMSVRKINWEERFGHTLTYATIVCRAQKPETQSTPTVSVIQPKKPFTSRFKFFLTGVVNHQVTINTLYSDGFLGTVEDVVVSNLPSTFLTEHRESQVKFQVEVSDNSLRFTIATDDIGARVQWYNYVSTKALELQTKFLPEDTEEITRLMIESGNYSPHAISNVLILHDYLKSNWPIEESLSKTKFRWIARDSEGSIIGHTAGLQVSNRLWAAIDNIGSQSYEGSWNREFVTKWITAFQEILEPYPDALVQWTFNPKAGVWTKFDELLKKQPSLVHCRDRIVSLFFDNIPYQLTKEDELGFNKTETELVTQALNSDCLEIEARSMLRAICDLSEAGNFTKHFQADYGFHYKRSFYTITLSGKPVFLLTFSNYPYWASLNKTHDWAYLFPIGESAFEQVNIYPLVSLLRTIISKSGSIPYRLGVVSSSFQMPQDLQCVQWTNLFLKASALAMAAKSVEGS